MKKLFVFLMAIVAVTFWACTDSEDVGMGQPQSDRMTFVDRTAFNRYLATQSSTATGQVFSGSLTSKSVIEQFRECTVVGKLLNKDLEFQIGDTIYKYCESGLGAFEIVASKYKEFQSYYKKEKELIAKLDDFEKVSPCEYRITDGLIFMYTGEPVIVVQNVVSPLPTRVSQDGLTKVQTTFWRSSGIVTSSCGVMVEAWSRENTSQEFQAANSDLTLEWNIQVRAERSVPTFRSSQGGLANKGNMIRQQVFSVNGYDKFTLWTNSIIVGRVKCWDGTWIEARVTK